MFNVLVAEDDKNIRKLMELRLSAEGYNVYSAGDGEEALKLMEGNQIDIMIVDVMMPKMDGYELVKTVRETDSQIPAIMVTAKGSIQDKAKGFNVGIDDYMVKPVEFDELIFRIKALLRRAKIVNERKITVGDVTLDYDTLSVSGHGKKVTLSKRSFLFYLNFCLIQSVPSQKLNFSTSSGVTIPMPTKILLRYISIKLEAKFQIFQK